MLLTEERPQAFREYRVAGVDVATVAAGAVAAARGLRSRDVGCTGWAVHLSHDRQRVVTVEAWNDQQSYRRHGHRGDVAGSRPITGLYRRSGSGGIDPTPVADPTAGVIVIDVFAVWRALLWPVSAFNLRNSRAFHRRPGCLSTTVLRGVGTGRIATYARWRTTEDFLAAFTATQGTEVDSTDAVNQAVATMTRGLLNTDYHTYDLVDSDEGAR